MLSRLTGNRVEKDPTKNQYISISSQYRPESFDVPLILRQTMFYQASGGQNYVHLLNRYQHFVDLSSHLAAGPRRADRLQSAGGRRHRPRGDGLGSDPRPAGRALDVLPVCDPDRKEARGK